MDTSDEAASWMIHIDDFDDGIVNGWGLHRQRPDVPITIEISSTGGEKLIVMANAFRRDLLDAGLGNGRHGFSVDLGRWDLAGNTITVRPDGVTGPVQTALISVDLALSLRGKPWSSDYLKMLNGLASPFLTAKDA